MLASDPNMLAGQGVPLICGMRLPYSILKDNGPEENNKTCFFKTLFIKACFGNSRGRHGPTLKREFL